MQSMIDKLQQHRIIPVVEIERAEDAVPLAEAIVDGGINVIEITLRTDAAMEAIRNICTHVPALLVGAGTVLTIDQAKSVLDAGVHFGVAPGLNTDVVAHFSDNSIPFIPGVLTPSELETALAHQCKLLKFFPAEAAGGQSFIKAISAPYKNHGVKICATGGITIHNMLDYLKTPMVWAIGGSWIATRQQIVDNKWQLITSQAQAAIDKLHLLDTSKPD